MGLFARNKGRRGEQEFCTDLRENLGDLGTFERNSMQSRMGGKDVLTNLPYAFEVKRAEKPAFNQWLVQASEQAAPNEVPVVVWRQNGKPWLLVLAVNLSTFCHIARAVWWYHKSGRFQQDVAAGKLGVARDVQALPNYHDADGLGGDTNAAE